MRGRNSNNDLIREALQWDYSMTLEEGIAKTYAWISEQIAANYRRMKITILGSAGQIGAYLSEYLSNKGHDVTDIDIVNGPEFDLRVTPNTVVEKAIESADFVFFLAFDVGGSRYLKKYQHTFEFINNNTRMMANTFRLLDKYKKRFVFASSQMSNMSYSPYGVMKRVGELHTTALKGLTVKFWNVYGIEHDMEKAHM